MASTYTTRVGLEKQGDGDNANTWGLVLNENVIDLVDEAVAGYESISLAGGGITLTNTDGATNQARNFGLKFTGALPADTTVVVPAKEKIYYVHNSTTENYNVFLKPAGGTAVTVVEAGRSMIAAVDGTNINTLESVDPGVYATKVEVQTLSATMATSINNSNVARASLSATMATSINNSNTAITVVSATMATSINNSNLAITSINNILNGGTAFASAGTSATLETRIATVSSTMATSINNSNTAITSINNILGDGSAYASAGTSATLETRIAGVSSTFAATSATLEGRIAAVSSTMATSVNNLKTGITGGTIVAATATNATNAASATNATNLDGNNSAYYRNAGNLNAGTLLAARLSGDYSINNTGTLDGYNGSDFLRVTAESLVQDGYITLSNGVIIQWGRKSLTSGSGQTLTWNTPFTTACYMALGVLSGSANANSNIAGGTLGTSSWTSIDTGATGTYHWIAIGK